MELEQLRCFVAAAEGGSISAGARRLYRNHSGASRSITALERELGVSLLKRGNRRAELTEAGERLLPAARELLAQADELSKLARGD